MSLRFLAGYAPMIAAAVLSFVMVSITGLSVSGDDAVADQPSEHGEIVFRNARDDAPLDLTFRPEQIITPAVTAFQATGKNPYNSDPEKVEAGQALYMTHCKSCHLEDGSGRLGPSLIDDETRYERTGTGIGRFEIIYGGGAGAMQAFGKRIDQDQILQIMAFVNSLANK